MLGTVSTLVGGLLASFLYTKQRALSSMLPLSSSSPDIKLSFYHDELVGLRFWVTFVAIIFGSLVTRLGLTSKRQYIEATPSSSLVRGGTDDTTHIIKGAEPNSVEMPFRITQTTINTYLSCVGPPPDSTPPLTAESLFKDPLHLQVLLSAVAEPAILLLLSKRGCLIDPLGSVAVRNRFDLLVDPEKFAEILSSPAASELRVRASLGNGAKKVKRGWEYSQALEVLSGDDVLSRQIYTMLQFEKHSPRFEPKAVDRALGEGATEPQQEVVAEFTMSKRDPHVWATLSKDYNLIHVSDIAAKAFGFRSIIAHGVHVVAKAFEATRGQRDGDEAAAKARWIEIEMRRPTFLPAKLQVKRRVKSSVSGVGAGSAGVVEYELCEKGRATVVVKFS